MASFSFSGIATGLDTATIVDQLVKIRRRPLDLEIADRDATQEKRDAFSTLETKLLAVRSALANLRAPTDVLVKTAATSDEDVLAATAGTGAANGITNVNVTQLASASRATASTGRGDVTETVAGGTGTFAFTVGDGDVQTVNLTAATTLDELIDSINALNAGVTASAVNVGTPSAASYKLQIVANNTGTPSNIAVVNDGTSLGITATAGTNAQFTISGFTETIERASNTIGDVIPGVSIQLKRSNAAAEVTVGDDGEAVETKVQDFVDAFNDLVTFVNENSQIEEVDEETLEAGPFVGNPTVRGILDRLRTQIGTSITDTASGVTTLSQIGIATQQDGTLRFDAVAFGSQFGTSPQGVSELFGGVGTADGVGDLIHASITQLTQAGGLLPNVQSGLDEEIARADDAIDAGERAIDAFRADLEAQFVSLESTVGTIQAQGNFLLTQLQAIGRSAPSSRTTSS
jgi:flagellar hook-associated protein 2